MPPGKPFANVTDAQRALFNNELKDDAVTFLKHAAGGGVDYLRANPQSPIRQTIEAVEHNTGAVTVLMKIVHAYVQERGAEKAQAEAGAAKPNPASASSSPKVQDAEIIEEPK